MSDEFHPLDTRTPWWGEHAFRYESALNAIQASDKVLDIAAGNGWGTSVLASRLTTGEAVGGDISSKATEKCNELWSHIPRLKFLQMDGTKLPFDDAYFDKIVSFETIEHTTQFERMLLEFSRVLKPGGTAFISTPNRPVNSPDGVKNPYHTQEFDYEELHDLLNRYFKSVKILGQRVNTKTSGLKQMIRGILRLRGITKIPYDFRNKISTNLTGHNIYLEPHEFSMENDKEIMKTDCVTFFAVCKRIEN